MRLRCSQRGSFSTREPPAPVSSNTMVGRAVSSYAAHAGTLPPLGSPSRAKLHHASHIMSDSFCASAVGAPPIDSA
jgi:hypothetical protein